MLHDSPTELARRSLHVRRHTAQLRHQLAAGELTVADVMREQPAALGDRALFEILLMARGIGRNRVKVLARKQAGKAAKRHPTGPGHHFAHARARSRGPNKGPARHAGGGISG